MHKLTESSSKLSQAGNLWEVVLITPGKGSSGIYTEDMLKNFGPKAFSAGSHSYIGHLSEGEQRNPEKAIGVLAEDAVYEEGRGLVGKLKVFKHWKDFVEEVSPYVGMSISAMGNGKDTEEGYIVEELIPDIQNTIDLVSYAGRGGALAEKLYESAINTSLNEGSDLAVAAGRKNGKDNLLEIEELAQKVDSLSESFKVLSDALTSLTESLATPEVPTKEVDVAAAVESAIDKTTEAGIPKELRATIIEAAKSGGDVDAAIAAQKAVVEAVRSLVVTESAGRTVGASDDADYRVAGLRF